MSDHPGKQKLDELVAGLDGVTPGPWHVDSMGRIYYRPNPLTKYVIAEMESSNGITERHIVRCDPDTIRSISEAFKALEAENERLRALIAAGDR